MPRRKFDRNLKLASVRLVVNDAVSEVAIHLDISPVNQHNSRIFKGLYNKIQKLGKKALISDAGYKTPVIVKLLIDDQIRLLFPYKRPLKKKAIFGNTSKSMTNIMTAIFVLLIKYWNIALRSEKDTVNIETWGKHVKNVHI